MSHPVTEHDLLALVEGRLPADRVEAVRAALSADKELLRRVEGMVRDRRAMERLGASAPAPLGMVEGAMAAAERGELLQHPATGRSGDRHRSRRRIIPFAIAATFLLLVSGVVAVVLLVSSPSQQRERVAQAEESVTRMYEQGSVIMPEWEQPEEPMLPGMVALDPVTGPTVDEPLTIVREAFVATPDPVLEEWFRSVEERAAAAPMDIDRAVDLLLEGRLALQTDVDPATTRAVAGEQGVSEPALITMADTATDSTWALPLTYPHGDREALRAALEGALDELRMMSGASVELVEATEPQNGAPPRPVLSFEDVLWWATPHDQWVRRDTVRLPVRVEPGDG
ncbi:MAG: hypothetical protein AAFX05_00500 [Planctomycetota bacterium]